MDLDGGLVIDFAARRQIAQHQPRPNRLGVRGDDLIEQVAGWGKLPPDD
jgi:hypothetical protein